MKTCYSSELRWKALAYRLKMIKALLHDFNFVFENPHLLRKISKLPLSIIRSYYREYIESKNK